MRLAMAVVLAWASTARAQAPPKAGPTTTEPAKPEPEQAPVVENKGKPMLLPFQCTDEDMQWAGMSCTDEQPCPVYLEISAMETVGNRIIAVANIHTESVTLYSLLLLSDDAGATWREPYQRMRGTGLDHLQFIDFQNGWISGETLVPVSRDPFLLITSDGGQSWRLRPVFNEGGGGAIQQFWFQTATSGALVIDRMESTEGSRYELYETPNAGETWMIRRTSERPIELSRAASDASAAGWRIRPDARSKSFAIEKHQGERWSAIASFLVEVGSCKPAPQVAPAPPEPVEPTQPAPPTPAPTLKRPKPKP